MGGETIKRVGIGIATGGLSAIGDAVSNMMKPPDVPGAPDAAAVPKDDEEKRRQELIRRSLRGRASMIATSPGGLLATVNPAGGKVLLGE
jgi:hypothetical protein